MSYNVYVIKLDKKVLLSKKFRRRNPDLDPKLDCYYVGQTSLDTEIRFQQHLDGYKASRFPKRYGISLCPEIYKKYNPIKTRSMAEELESWLTTKLRKKGHGVWSN